MSMKFQKWIVPIVFMGAALLPGLIKAQKFQEPTKDELQMTTDPKAPGAPAVYLYREKVTDNNRHFISEYARIKVLTEKGKDKATVEVPYGGNGAPPHIEGRTIHPDGTVVPLTGSGPELLVQSNREGRSNVRVFTLPSVEVGSILEYRWTLPIGEGRTGGVSNDNQGYFDSALASAIAYWDVQKDLFIHKEHFYYDPLNDLERNVVGNLNVTHYVDGEIASYLLYSEHLPPGAKVAVSPRRDYDLVVQDVPPITHELYAPPEMGREYSVRFFYSPYLSGDVYWESEGKRWQKEIDRAADASEALKSAAAEITAGAATDEAKARKLYDAVQALGNFAFTGGGAAPAAFLGGVSEIRPADQVWSAKGGGRNDIAILYLALARADGLHADAMEIPDRRFRIFDPGYLSLSQFNTDIVILHVGDRDVFVDPGEKLLPFGQLRWSHTLCGGLAETSTGVSRALLTPANLTKDAITAHAANFVVDPSGTISGTVQLVMNGPEALELRQLNLTAGAGSVNQRLAESLRRMLPLTLNAEIAGIKGMETSEGYLQVTANVSGTLGTVTGKRLLLPAFPFSSGSPEQFASEESRESPVDMHYAEQVIDDVVYHLPAGYAVQGAPQAAQMPWPEHADLVIKVAANANTLDVRHTFARAFVLLDAKEYPALHDYYAKIAVNDQQQVVLSPASGAGN